MSSTDDFTGNHCLKQAWPPIFFVYGLICCVFPELEIEREDRWRLQRITGYSIAMLSVGTNSGAGAGDNYKDQAVRTRGLGSPVTLKLIIYHW